jgi:hypothetical protein
MIYSKSSFLNCNIMSLDLDCWSLLLVSFWLDIVKSFSSLYSFKRIVGSVA